MPEIDVQAIWSRMMGQDIAICGLLETLARVQPAVAKAVAEDIRSKAAELENSRATQAAEASKRAVSYAEIIERITRGENQGTQNAELNAIRAQGNNHPEATR
jgi:hypothetical protein